MNLKKLKIELYATRDFGKKLSDVMEFVRVNWRVLLKYETYFLLPICVVLAFFSNRFIGDYFGLITTIERMGAMGVGAMGVGASGWVSMAVNMLGTVVFYMIGYVALSAVVFTILHLYFFRDQDSSYITFEDMKAHLGFFAKRFLVLMLVSVLIGIAVIAVIGIAAGIIFAITGGFLQTAGFLILAYFLLIIIAVVVGVPLMLVMPIYMLEPQITVIGAYRKALRLGFATWIGVFGVTFVIGLIASILQSFTMAPWYVMIFVKQFFTLANHGEAGFTGTFVYDFFLYLFCIVQCFGSFVASMFTIVGTTIQYGHAADKIDGQGVAQHIEQFDNFDNL